ncbi:MULTISPECIES: hypothetical protein [unclassified Streptomyces]|uniref:hypothetical protein n=1 Tax=unclassified Streptomyces TaxID=2593676 RepID=UPI0036EFD9BF
MASPPDGHPSLTPPATSGIYDTTTTRVQVSADCRRRRTAATVRDGQGGRESVRMDAQDNHCLRIQDKARVTAYGCSLRSVEAHTVASTE